MTNIHLYKEGGHIVRFIVSGHTGYAEAGRDIVCAAVSSAVWLVANGLHRLARAEVSQKDDKVFCSLPFDLNEAERKTADDLLQSFVWFIDSLVEQYGEFVRKTEV